MTNDLVPTTPGALSPVDDEWAGFDDGLVGREAARLQMPRIVSDMRPGQGYTNEVTGERVDHLSFVWLARKWTRAAWIDENGEKREFGEGDPFPDCWSDNMETPHPDAPWADKPDACAVCPLSQFGPNGEAPACQSRLNVFAFDVENGHYFRTWFSGSGIKHADAYISSLKARRPARPTFAQVTDVKLVEVRGETDRTKGRIWLEPEISPGPPTTPAEVGPLLATRDQFIGQWEAAVGEDIKDQNPGNPSAATTARDEFDVDETPF